MNARSHALSVGTLLCSCLAVASPASAVFQEGPSNDTVATADALSPAGVPLSTSAPGGGVLIEATLVPNDIDHFAFDLVAGELLTVTIDEADAGRFNDPRILLFSPANQLVASDDDGGRRFLASLSYLAPQTGRYTLGVTGFGSVAILSSAHNQDFAYRALVAVGSVPPGQTEGEAVGGGGANDAQAGATVVTLADGVAVVSGEVTELDPDHFEVQVPGGDLIVAVYENGGHTFADHVVSVLDAAGNEVAFDDDEGPGFGPQLVYASGAPGTWTILVENFSHQTTFFEGISYPYELVVSTPDTSLPIERCDVDDNDFIDRRDIDAIFAALGQPASGPTDPRDEDGDATITIADGRNCVLQCDLVQCQVPPPPCGGGMAMVLFAPAILWARRGWRRR